MQDIIIEVMHMEIKAQELDGSPLIITGNSWPQNYLLMWTAVASISGVN